MGNKQADNKNITVYLRNICESKSPLTQKYIKRLLAEAAKRGEKWAL